MKNAYACLLEIIDFEILNLELSFICVLGVLSDVSAGMKGNISKALRKNDLLSTFISYIRFPVLQCIVQCCALCTFRRRSQAAVKVWDLKMATYISNWSHWREAIISSTIWLWAKVQLDCECMKIGMQWILNAYNFRKIRLKLITPKEKRWALHLHSMVVENLSITMKRFLDKNF